MRLIHLAGPLAVVALALLACKKSESEQLPSASAQAEPPPVASVAAETAEPAAAPAETPEPAATNSPAPAPKPAAVAQPAATATTTATATATATTTATGTAAPTTTTTAAPTATATATAAPASNEAAFKRVSACCGAINAEAKKGGINGNRYAAAGAVCSGIAQQVKTGIANESAAKTLIRAQLQGITIPGGC